MKFLRAIVAIVVLVAFDQYTKYMIVEHFAMHEYYPIAGDIFGLYYLQNEGMSWGMFQGKQVVFLIFTVIVLIAVGFLYVRLLRDSYFRPLNVCMLFLGSGAIGNMIDRVLGTEFLHTGNTDTIQFLHGGVVDFLYIKLINFPVFNVADMYVTLSIAVIVVLLFTKYRHVELEGFLGKEAHQEVAVQHNEASRSSEVSEDITSKQESSDISDHQTDTILSDPKETESSDSPERTTFLHHIFSNEEEEDD